MNTMKRVLLVCICLCVTFVSVVPQAMAEKRVMEFVMDADNIGEGLIHTGIEVTPGDSIKFSASGDLCAVYENVRGNKCRPGSGYSHIETPSGRKSRPIGTSLNSTRFWQNRFYEGELVVGIAHINIYNPIRGAATLKVEVVGNGGSREDWIPAFPDNNKDNGVDECPGVSVGNVIDNVDDRWEELHPNQRQYVVHISVYIPLEHNGEPDRSRLNCVVAMYDRVADEVELQCRAVATIGMASIIPFLPGADRVATLIQAIMGGGAGAIVSCEGLANRYRLFADGLKTQGDLYIADGARGLAYRWQAAQTCERDTCNIVQGYLDPRYIERLD